MRRVLSCAITGIDLLMQISCDSSILFHAQPPNCSTRNHQTAPDPPGKSLPSCIRRSALVASGPGQLLDRILSAATQLLTIAPVQVQCPGLCARKSRSQPSPDRHHDSPASLVSDSDAIVPCDRGHITLPVCPFPPSQRKLCLRQVGHGSAQKLGHHPAPPPLRLRPTLEQRHIFFVSPFFLTFFPICTQRI